MDDEAIGFTEEQKAVFDAFCGLLTTAKRNELKQQYVKNIDDDIETVDLKSLEVDGIKVFEAYHIIKFYTDTKKLDGAGKNLIREFKGRETKPKSQAEITKIASEKSYSKEATAEIFKILAKARNVELPECFLQFLKFCREKHLPLRVFSSKSELDSYISDLESGLAPSVEPFNLSWNKGSLSLTTDPHTFEPNIPNNSAAKNIDNVASILTWDCQLTPLIGRDNELTELHDWAESEAEKSIKIISGAGGVGKTRLAFHFAEQLKDKGWSAGQIAFDQIGVCKLQHKGLVLIIDEAHSPVATICKSLTSLKNLHCKHYKIRILLTCRNSEFVNEAYLENESLFSAELPLQGLTAQAWELFNVAYQEISNLCDTDNALSNIDKSTFSRWLEINGMHSTPLILIALSLYFIDEGELVGLDASLNNQKILRHISKREAYRIRAELFAEPTITINYDIEALLLLIAVSAINGGLNSQEIRELFQSISSEPVDYVLPQVKDIKRLSLWADKHITPLKPDLLAADFLAYCLENFADNQEYIWVINVLNLGGFSDENTEDSKFLQNYTRFSKLVFDYNSLNNQTSRWQWPIKNIAQKVKDDTYLSYKIAKSSTFIIGINFTVSEIDITAFETSLTQPLPDFVTTNFYTNLCGLLTNQRSSKAKAAFDEAFARVSRIAEANTEYQPNLIALFINRAVYLTQHKDYAEACDCLNKALALHETFEYTDPVKRDSNLAHILNQYSIIWYWLGDQEKALGLSLDACEIQKHLALTGSQKHCHVYASYLSSLSDCFYAQKRYEEACIASRDSLAIYENLYTNAPNTYSLDYARSLDRTGSHEFKLGKIKQAEMFYLQALRIYEPLCNATLSNSMLLHCYRTNLMNIILVSEKSGYPYDKRVKYLEKLISALKKLLQVSDSPAYYMDLIKQIEKLAYIQMLSGDINESLRLTEEAIQVGETIHLDNDGQIYFASLLNNFSVRLNMASQFERSFEASIKSILGYKTCKITLKFHQTSYANALNTVVDRLINTGFTESALNARISSVCWYMNAIEEFNDPALLTLTLEKLETLFKEFLDYSCQEGNKVDASFQPFDAAVVYPSWVDDIFAESILFFVYLKAADVYKKSWEDGSSATFNQYFSTVNSLANIHCLCIHSTAFLNDDACEKYTQEMLSHLAYILDKHQTLDIQPIIMIGFLSQASNILSSQPNFDEKLVRKLCECFRELIPDDGSQFESQVALKWCNSLSDNLNLNLNVTVDDFTHIVAPIVMLESQLETISGT
ncbi:MAG: hypothetical protein ACFHVJ_10930 [Aestuariibacter sp.]